MATRPFAGRDWRFYLRFGEITELERLTGMGIGPIFMRIGAQQFGHRDVWDTSRLGLEGGRETSAAEATVLVMRYQGEPLTDFLPLAGAIVAACVNGVPRRETDSAGNAPAERSSADPVTSLSSTPSSRSSAGRRKRSGT